MGPSYQENRISEKVHQGLAAVLQAADDQRFDRPRRGEAAGVRRVQVVATLWGHASC